VALTSPLIPSEEHSGKALAWHGCAGLKTNSKKAGHVMQQKDPVCGMSVDTNKAMASTQSQGKTYYFCSQECKEKFDRNPAQYVRKGA
jgi:YHS domain-containing protein